MSVDPDKLYIVHSKVCDEFCKAFRRPFPRSPASGWQIDSSCLITTATAALLLYGPIPPCSCCRTPQRAVEGASTCAFGSSLLRKLFSLWRRPRVCVWVCLCAVDNPARQLLSSPWLVQSTHRSKFPTQQFRYPTPRLRFALHPFRFKLIRCQTKMLLNAAFCPPRTASNGGPQRHTTAQAR